MTVHDHPRRNVEQVSQRRLDQQDQAPLRGGEPNMFHRIDHPERPGDGIGHEPQNNDQGQRFEGARQPAQHFGNATVRRLEYTEDICSAALFS